MSLDSAILLTLRYSSHFSFPLKDTELHTRLIKHKVTLVSLRKELKRLLVANQIGRTNSYYHLPKESYLVSQRISREEASRPLKHRSRVLAASLFSLPGILAFYLTGSLSVSNADDDGDIDLLTVTYPHSLWITRLILTLTTSLLRLRRTRGSSKNYGKLCLNLYLTPQAFVIPESRRSLYTAYELIQAVPIYDPHNTHPYLLMANPWLKDYLPNYVLPSLDQPFMAPKTPFLLRLFEPLAFGLQYAYMKSHITRELISHDAAFFHPNNPGSKILKNLKVK